MYYYTVYNCKEMVADTNPRLIVLYVFNDRNTSQLLEGIYNLDVDGFDDLLFIWVQKK